MNPVLTLDIRSLATGIGRYSEHLISGLRECLPGIRVKGITHSQNLDRLRPYVDDLVPCDAGMYSARSQWEIPFLAADAALLHCQHYNIPVLYRRPLSVTIHDITHLLDPAFRNTVRSRCFAAPMLRLAVRRAVRIVTVSNYSKRMLEEHLGCDARKIVVIPNEVHPMFREIDRKSATERVRMSLNIEPGYLLFVGSLKPHKNLSLLLKAYSILRHRRIEAPQLLVIGSDPIHGPKLRREAIDLGLCDHVQWRENVPDGILPYAYAAGTALILPSREEGFGLPIIEAMACGTPVICSNAAALPEVAGGAALHFDVSSAEDCCDQIVRVMDKFDIAAQLTEKGRMRAMAYSGKEAVAAHARLFADLCQA